MKKTTFFMLLLLTPVQLCFAQISKPSEPQFGALLAFEREIEVAAARGDVAFLDRAIADDFTFTHGDAWRTGGAPSRVDTKKSWMEAVARGLFVSRQVDSQQVEPHASVAITTGRIDVKLKPPFLNNGKAEYTVWFVRVYRAKAGGWELVSHRTVAEN
ncbi:MAG: nuclear transport factor 2 family protein [Gemmatimonas sp.]